MRFWLVRRETYCFGLFRVRFSVKLPRPQWFASYIIWKLWPPLIQRLVMFRFRCERFSKLWSFGIPGNCTSSPLKGAFSLVPGIYLEIENLGHEYFCHNLIVMKINVGYYYSQTFLHCIPTCRIFLLPDLFLSPKWQHYV